MVRLEVQRVEVEPLGFHLGAFGDLPAHAHEDVRDAVLQDRQRVAGSGAAAARGGGDVDGFLDEDACGFGFFQHHGAGGQGLVDPSAGAAHELAGDGLFRLVQLADLAVGQRQRRLLAGVRQTRFLQLGQVPGGFDGRQGGFYCLGNRGFIGGVRNVRLRVRSR